jgi:SAM-dependent methyltransferase
MANLSKLAYKLVPWVPPALLGVLVRKSLPNLSGDRDIEWSWVSANMPEGPGEALDFGPGASFSGLIAAQRGFTVTAVDLEPVEWLYTHDNLKFIQGDILKAELPAKHFDLIINCSTVEHVGLVGRYGTKENRANGDLSVMAHLRDLMKPGGKMLLTVPSGQDAVYSPWHRVYGNERLPRLTDGYHIDKQAFWLKNDKNQWHSVERAEALNFQTAAGSWNPLRNIYALACFVLSSA